MRVVVSEYFTAGVSWDHERDYGDALLVLIFEAVSEFETAGR